MKLNKYLLIFSSLFLFLFLSYLIILYKFFPVLFHHTIYFCQEMIKSLSLGLPGDIGNFIFALLTISIIYTLAKFLASITKIFSFRKNLYQFVTINKSLNPLLKKLKLENKVVILKNVRPFAFCFGIRNPKIYISTKLLKITGPAEIEVILRHEKYHLDRKDTLIQLLAVLIESLFPFFPVFSDFIRNYRQDREINADRAAVRASDGKRFLSSALQNLLHYDPAPLPLVPAFTDVNTIETRIKTLLNLDVLEKKFPTENMLLSLMSFIMLFGLTVTPVKGTDQKQENHHNGIECTKTLYSPANFTPADL